MTGRGLSVVAPGTTGRAAPKSILEAAEVSERALLVALRTHLSAEMDAGAVPAHALASVGAKIREYDREIRAIDTREADDAARRADPTDQPFDASAV